MAGEEIEEKVTWHFCPFVPAGSSLTELAETGNEKAPSINLSKISIAFSQRFSIFTIHHFTN